MTSIKDMVSGGKIVKFDHYVRNELWYRTECGFLFPVPIEDTGDGVFLDSDKAILFMRYIRKHKEMLEKAQMDQEHQNNQKMITVDGKSFRCECGSNVFTQFGKERYSCNGCQALYTGIKVDLNV